MTKTTASRARTSEIARPAHTTQGPGRRRQAAHKVAQTTVPTATATQ